MLSAAITWMLSAAVTWMLIIATGERWGVGGGRRCCWSLCCVSKVGRWVGWLGQLGGWFGWVGGLGWVVEMGECWSG